MPAIHKCRDPVPAAARSGGGTWTGHMYSPQEANQISGIKRFGGKRIRTFVRAFRNRQPYRPKADKIS